MESDESTTRLYDEAQRAEMIQRAAQHMLRLVRDLTDVADVDAGRLADDRKVEDPAEVAREVRDALDHVVTRHGGTLLGGRTGITSTIGVGRTSYFSIPQ